MIDCLSYIGTSSSLTPIFVSKYCQDQTLATPVKLDFSAKKFDQLIFDI